MTTLTKHKMVTPGQIQRMHTLLSKTGETAYKQDHMDDACIDGRYPTSSRELYFEEAEAIITKLANLQRHQQTAEWKVGDNMRKAIISHCREMGWEKTTPQGVVADMARINAWVLKYGYLKKELNKYTNTELPELVTQAERMRDSFLIGIAQKK